MIEHRPEYRYDCDNCKFSWTCGYGCACDLKLPDPPRNVQLLVNEERKLNKLSLEFEDE